ncbi:hypothetical protein [Sphingobium nicotianae]|uniref:Uncharacterized protein n=1 Tax=Sphingobium nicotianae TaxID=2782607 RepID=A0A9X1DBL4_9SPHN|nr:hypothetical protein [Sphingobium nicotianae]MBT2186708.1 hypothetical protein [Sphingobium nicotianae]
MRATAKSPPLEGVEAPPQSGFGAQSQGKAAEDGHLPIRCETGVQIMALRRRGAQAVFRALDDPANIRTYNAKYY